MKKCYLLTLFSALFLGTVSISAQTILDEDFETTNTDASNSLTHPVAKGDGWTTVDSYTGTTAKYKWMNYYYEKGTIGGTHVAMCDGSIFDDEGADGTGPREEMLVTPELNLDNTYQLSFDWIVSPMASVSKTLYDLQVRVVENGDIDNAETIFSIQNKDDLKESGVSEYPIKSWNVHTSKLDLSDWKGKKIKLAFVYKMLTTSANVVYLDNVSVKKFTPATGPMAQLSSNTYDFGKIYVGEKFYSEPFRLTNVGKDGLKIESADLPQGVAMTIAPSTFPPAGWKNNGWGKGLYIEGDVSPYATGSLYDQYLTSPRLDLTKGGKVQFEYYNQFNSEDGSNARGSCRQHRRRLPEGHQTRVGTGTVCQGLQPLCGNVCQHLQRD